MHDSMVSVSDGMRWHVLSVERTPLAQRSLERRNIECWLPLCSVRRIRRPRGARHDEVMEWRGHLFPGYVLARFVSAFWGVVQELDGIEGVIMAGPTKPATLADAWVDALAAEIDQHGGALKITDDGKRRDPNPPRKRGPLYAKGTRLRVTDGPFTSFEGLYLADSKGRIALLLDFLGGTREISIPEALAIPA